MSTTSLLERLSMHRTLSAMPPHEVAWVAAHGSLRHLATGGILTPKQGTVEGLHIVLSGHLTIHVDQGTGPRKIMEWRGGDVTGFMPYSRLVGPPGDVVAEEPTEVVTVFRADMDSLIRECPQLTATLVHVMLDRARHFTSSYLHDEKLVSLGKLAAGLAHELNNPAAAIRRSAGGLRAARNRSDEASRSLGAARLDADQIAAIQNVRDACLAVNATALLSPLEQEDRENAISDWIAGRKADSSLAEALAETGITLQMLDGLASTVEAQHLNTALRWIAADCETNRLTFEIHQAASRICELVDAVKGFTQMDRAAVPEPVDLRRGLMNTFAVLGSKAKAKSIGIRLNLQDELPAVHGFAGELNQVWSNLIDNALDAVDEGGQVEVNATYERERVVVRVVDNGCGIPASIRDRVFDPFFTTKPVGQGTGLGLDIVRRLVQRHNGQIEVESSPGRTEFRVIFPAPSPR